MKPVLYIILSLVLILVEISCHAYLKTLINPYSLSMVYLVSGLSIPFIIFLFRIQHNPINLNNSSSHKRGVWVLGSLLLCLLFFHYVEVNLREVPIDYRTADMIPVLQIMAERFLNDRDVYAVIPEIWNGTKPIYLPALWMPFCLTNIVNTDPRWFISILLILSISITLWASSKHFTNLIATGILSLILITSITIVDPSMITLTQEGIVIFYYVLLAIALLRGNIYMIGLCIALCLLSRYVLIGWVASFFIAGLFYQRTDSIIKIGITTLSVVFSLLYLSDSFSSLPTFFSLPEHYVLAVMDNPDKYNPTIVNNLGLAKFFSIEDLGILNNANGILAFVVPFSLFGGYRFVNNQINFYVYSLLVMKVSLVLFYNFLVIPYSYLFYTSTFLSLALISLLFTDSSDKILITPLK